MKIHGKKVIDAKRNLKITINSDDARKGKGKNPSECAAAVAIMRRFKPYGAKQARVHLGRVYIEYPDAWVRYQTPEALKAEIISFDRGATGEYMEGNYTLYKPSPTNKLGRVDTSRTQGKRPVGRPHIKTAIRHHHIGVRSRGANR